jgi:DNA-binding MarR family transcriptional regulator
VSYEDKLWAEFDREQAARRAEAARLRNLRPSPRQRQVLQLIWDCQRMGQLPPTVREMAAALDITIQAVVDLVAALLRKGLLEKAAAKSARALRLTSAGRTSIGAPPCDCSCHQEVQP